MRLHKRVAWLEHWQNKSGPLFYMMVTQLLNKYKNEVFSQRARDDWNELTAWLLFKYHDDKLALEASHKAIELDAGCKDSWYMEGVAYEELGEHEKALSALNEAIQIDGKFLEAHEVLAQVYTKLGMYREAHQEYLMLSQANERYQPPWQQWGKMLEKHGKCSEVIAAAMEGVDRCKDSQFWLSLANRLSHNNLYREEALMTYDQAIFCDSSNSIAREMKMDVIQREKFYDRQIQSHAKNLH